MKPIQYFSDEYLARCREFSPLEIVKFLDDFAKLRFATAGGSVLISIKIPAPLLSAFKAKAHLSGTKYQTKIKELMSEWIA